MLDDTETIAINTCNLNNTHKMTREEFTEYYTHRIAGKTDIGLERDVNEDSYGYFTDRSESNFIVIVADGVGGHEKGDEASKNSVKTLLGEWRNLKNTSNSFRFHKKHLKKSILKANHNIYSENSNMLLDNPMGTTLTAGVFTDNFLIIGHVGDSKCFRINLQGELDQLTEDHTLVYELFKQKMISEYQMENHPLSHVISRAIGPDEEVEVDIYKYNREPGASYIFCSDGVSNHVSNDEIREIILDANNPEIACDNIVQAALDDGGLDNITAICVFD